MAKKHRFLEQLGGDPFVDEDTADEGAFGGNEFAEMIAQEAAPTPLTLHARAQALFNLGRFGEADQAVDVCMQAAPTYPECALLKANTLSKTGRKEAAVAMFEQAKALKAAETASGRAVP